MNSKLAVSAKALVACILLGAIPAQATTIEIGVASGSGAIQTVATGTGSTGVSWAGVYDNYVVSAFTASDPGPIDLGSATLDITGGAKAPLYVYVTETGLTASQVTENFLSTLSASLPSSWQETETTWVGAAAYGEGTQLASMSGSGAKNVTTSVNFGSVGSTFSLTEVYEIISDGFAGVDASSEGVQAAPAPSLGSGIPAMLAVGAMLLGAKRLGRPRRS
jgi:hypothetical protein